MEGSFSNNFLIALLSLLTLGNSASAGRTIPKTNTEFIKTSCSTTMYPQLCYTSLSSHTSTIQTSPKLLAHTALLLSLHSTKSASAMMVRLSQGHNMSPRIVSALKDCIEELGDSVDQLRNSLREMSELGGSSFRLMINDVQTWVSAALTNYDTCMDGFGDSAMNGNAKYAVRSSVLNIERMTSNALSLVNSYAEKHG